TSADVSPGVDARLNTAVPASPTANSVYERIKALDDAYTAARAALLDNLDAAITSRATSADVSPGVDARLNTAVPASPTANSVYERIKTLDDAYTAARAALLDNLNATITSRLAGSAYKDPDTTALSGAPTAGALTDLVRALEKRALSSPTTGSIGAKINTMPTDVWNAATRTLTAAPSVIASIQTGFLSGAPSSGTGEDARYLDVTIAAVNTAKSVVLLNGEGNGNSYVALTGRLLNSTTLRVADSTVITGLNCRWTVVEFA
ncbi:MAG: hypothetical protein HYY11_01225, partial [Candidatus Methylomirabilis oxyfera]|nr:hypothetical protein [Candidatus Methylomirabilis oxyfera]